MYSLLCLSYIFKLESVKSCLLTYWQQHCWHQRLWLKISLKLQQVQIRKPLLQRAEDCDLQLLPWEQKEPTVPSPSVASDLAPRIHWNGAGGIPGASTILHGQAWLQETLQPCQLLGSAHKCIRSRPLHSGLILVLADPPTHHTPTQGTRTHKHTHTSTHTPVASTMNRVIFSSRAQICSPAF